MQQQHHRHPGQPSGKSVFYLRQAQVDGRRLRDVHDFTVGGHDEHEAIQGLGEEPGCWWSHSSNRFKAQVQHV